MTVIVTAATDNNVHQSINQSVSQSSMQRRQVMPAKDTQTRNFAQQTRPNTADEIYAQEPTTTDQDRQFDN